MHLIKLQTPSSQASGYRRRPAAQPSRLLVTLLALGAASWRGSYQVVDSVADFAAAAAGSGASTGHNSALVELAHRRTQENLTEQKCRPVLNFALPQVDQRIPRQRAALSVTSSNNNFNNIQHYSTTGQKLSQSIPDSFSFPIGDINLPLTPTAGGLGSNPGNSNVGAVQAAMKLLAAFDAQLYGGGSGEADGDDSSGDTNLMADEEQNVVRFKQNRLFISGLNFTMLNVHLYQDAEPRFAIGVNIANTTLAGQFQYDGYAPASLIGSDYAKLAGHYRMSIDNLLLTVASNLTKVFKSGDQTSPVKYRYQLASNDLRMNISNLGYISIEILDAQDASKPTSNYVLKMLERVLQKTIKRTYNKFEDYIRSTLELEGRKFLDCELTRFAPLLTENLRDESRNRLPKVSPQAPIISTINDNNATQAAEATLVVLESITTTVFEKFPNNSYYLDDLAKIISTEIANSRLDKISLPDFDYQRSVFGSSADISFQNGSLSGLDNIRLTGETRVKLLEEHLIVNASVGWTDLRPQYNWTLYFGGGGGGSPSQHQESVTLVADNSDRRASMSAQINTTVTDITTSSSLSSKNQQAAQVKPSQQPQPTAKPMAKGFVSFSIKAIEFDAVISKSVRSQSRMVVDELIIRRLDNPKMDIGGLPGLNRLTRGAVNFFMGRLKQRLVSSIQPALKQELERALNRLALFN